MYFSIYKNIYSGKSNLELLSSLTHWLMAQKFTFQNGFGKCILERQVRKIRKTKDYIDSYPN